ncbi:MAG: PspA/IM30 family protein [Armatimonadetes bacterium]|nr:PspA/IM30 family protein [Armatimonadota bacterium]
MGLLARIWRVIKGWFLIGVEKAEDPEVILAEAQESMRREVERAKENAVIAIQQRNLLRNMLQQQENKAAELEALARQALRSGKEDVARQLLVERGSYQQQIEGLRQQLEQAEQAAEAVKVSIQRMEQQVRQRAAERLAMVARWKQAKIQEQLNRALSGISLEGHEEAFRRAEEKVQSLQAKADARLELAKGGIQEEIAQLHAGTASAAANEELERLKAEMGIGPAEVDQALEQIKAEAAADTTPQEQQTVRRNIEV